MDDLNYRHLLYFWVVTQEGSVTRASQKLNVAQPTISAQLKKFEQTLGARLFRRVGRSLELTETGRKVERYAGQIFELGDALMEHIQGRETAKPQPVSIGIARELPVALVEPLLSSAAHEVDSGTISVHTGGMKELLAALIAQRIDAVLASESGESHAAVRTYSRLIAEAPVVLAGTAELAARHRRGFPGSLQGAPLILPSPSSMLRVEVDRWLLQHRIRPQVVLQTDDEAWQQRWATVGPGLIATVKARSNHTWHVAGKLSGVKLACYAITLDRHPQHPALRAMINA